MAYPSVVGSLDELPDQLSEIKSKLLVVKKTSSLSVAGILSVADQVIKTEKLDFSSGSSLVFYNLDYPWIVLYADLLLLNGPAQIRRGENIDLTGDDGDNGFNAGQTTTSYGSSGSSGGDGRQGKDGKSQKIPVLYIFVKEINFKGPIFQAVDIQNNFSIHMDGYDGGAGGNGGDGGYGTNGRQGEPAKKSWVPFDCLSGPGHGGRGGNGGRGGIPGIGGDGSDGGRIYMFVGQQQENYFSVINCSLEPGRKGNNGRPGKSGAFGKGGAEGELEGSCRSSGRRGADGVSLPVCGIPDVTGHNGAKGADPSIWIYTNFSELQS